MKRTRRLESLVNYLNVAGGKINDVLTNDGSGGATWTSNMAIDNTSIQIVNQNQNIFTVDGVYTCTRTVVTNQNKKVTTITVAISDPAVVIGTSVNENVTFEMMDYTVNLPPALDVQVTGNYNPLFSTGVQILGVGRFAGTAQFAVYFNWYNAPANTPPGLNITVSFTESL